MSISFLCPHRCICKFTPYLDARGATRVMYVSVDAGTFGVLSLDRRMVTLATFCEASETKRNDFVLCLKFNGGARFQLWRREAVSNHPKLETVKYDVRSRLWARVRAESRESSLHALHHLQRRGRGLRGDDGCCCSDRFPRSEVSSTVSLPPRVPAVRGSRLPLFLSNSALVVSGSLRTKSPLFVWPLCSCSSTLTSS